MGILSQSRETIGYVCRWALLSLVALVGAVAAALAGYSVLNLPTEYTTDVMAPDFARAGVPPIYMPCYVTPPSPLRWMLISSIDDGPVQSYFSYNSKFTTLVSLTPQAVGDHHVSVVGCPYSSAAFEKHQATLRVVDIERVLYVIDAREVLTVAEAVAAGNASPERRTMMMTTLQKLSRVGTVLLLHPGTPAEMARDRRRLRQLNVSTPVVSDYQQGVPLDSLQRLLNNLRPGVKDHAAWVQSKVVIITADPEFYKVLKRVGYKAWLLGQ